MIRLQSEIFKLSNDTEAEFTTEQLSRFMRPSPVFSGFSILFMNNNEREESARHDNSRTALFSHVLMRPYSNADIIRTQDQIIRCQGFVNIFGVAVGSHAIVRAESFEEETITPLSNIDRVERIFVDVESTTLFGFISRLTNISLESFDNISATVHQEQLESNACVTDEFPAIAPLTHTDRAESVFLDEDITTHFGFTTGLTNISLEYILNTSTTVHQDQVELYAGVTDEFSAIAPPNHFARLGRVFNEEEITRNVRCITVNDTLLEPEHIVNTAVTVKGQQIELQTQITTEVTSPSSLYNFVRPESIFMDEQITRNLGFVSVLTDIAADLIANIPASL